MLPTLIERLLRPAAYPHPVGSIQLVQTHISWVVMTGDYVYKLKKPVRTEFLDYGDPQRRRHFCHQEVLLNARYAPQLYLGVVPVGGTPQQPAVGADPLRADDPAPAETQEYAVKMRQFPADALLSQRLRDDRLAPAAVDRFAQQIARFHAAADRVDPTSRWGAPDVVRDEAVANLDYLLGPGRHAWQGGSRADTADRLERLDRWTRQSFDALRDAFQDRRAAGQVRACHGDLHLSNVIEWQGQIIPFDGIEFSESLRWIDTISDVAFAAMDFDVRQHPRYAHRFVSAYLEASQDYAGLQVLRWYWVYRALVRAKVAAIQASQDDADPAQRRRQQDKCQLLIARAADHVRPATPRIMITHGVSGSGKTSGSQHVLEQVGAVRVRSDVIRKRRFGAPDKQVSASPGERQPPEADPDGSQWNRGIYSPAHTEQVYAWMAEIAEVAVRAGYPVLVDATFLARRHRARFAALADRLGVPLQILSFTADAAQLRQRLRDRASRGDDASDADESILRHQLATAEPLSDDERKRVVEMNEDR